MKATTVESRVDKMGYHAELRRDLSVVQGVKDLAKTRYAHYFTVNSVGNWERGHKQLAAAVRDAERSTHLLYESSTDLVFEVTKKPAPRKEAEVLVDNQGTVVLFRPRTQEAENWLRQNTDGQWFGNALCVEPRYAVDLLNGLRSDGLTVRAYL